MAGTPIPGDGKLAIVIGVVHPQAGNWGFETPIETDFGGERWVAVIRGSAFRVFIEPVPNLPDIETLRNETLDFVQGCLDALGYHVGAVLTPAFTAAFLSPNVYIEQMLFEPIDPTEVQNGFVAAARLEPFTRSAISEPLVRYALADVQSARARPIDTAFYCYRAVESVRQHFTANPNNRNAGWARMQRALKQSKPDHDWLRDQAKVRRHGDVGTIDGADRAHCLQIAHATLDAFVEHLHEVGHDDAMCRAPNR